MKIWIDGDGCPTILREIIFKAAKRTGISLVIVANSYITIPKDKIISFVKVGAGLDVADNEIVKRMVAGDLVITGDIPLAAEVIGKGGHALGHRGEFHSTENIGARLSMRDFMTELRASGLDTGGPAPFNKKDRQAFANQLDKFLSPLAVKR